MEQIPLWTVWLAFGAILVVGEMFTATFFIVCFGVGAFAASAVAVIGLGAVYPLATFFIVSALCVAFIRRFAHRYAEEPSRKAGVDRLLGQECVVIERIDSVKGTGRVQVLHEEWRADPHGSESYDVGEKVVVKDARGSCLVVSRKGDCK